MDNTFRLIVLGAGFSKPAGLPLADDLFHEVRKRVKQQHGLHNRLENDLAYYLNYLRKTESFKGSKDDINIERFLSFLDIEHYLGLKGSDTFSSEGNETQLIVRHAIGYILLDRTPKKVLELYKQFADNLTTSDYVLAT